jgi:hypothetical protein
LGWQLQPIVARGISNKSVARLGFVFLGGGCASDLQIKPGSVWPEARVSAQLSRAGAKPGSGLHLVLVFEALLCENASMTAKGTKRGERRDLFFDALSKTPSLQPYTVTEDVDGRRVDRLWTRARSTIDGVRKSKGKSKGYLPDQLLKKGQTGDSFYFGTWAGLVAKGTTSSLPPTTGATAAAADRKGFRCQPDATNPKSPSSSWWSTKNHKFSTTATLDAVYITLFAFERLARRTPGFNAKMVVAALAMMPVLPPEIWLLVLTYVPLAPATLVYSDVCSLGCRCFGMKIADVWDPDDCHKEQRGYNGWWKDCWLKRTAKGQQRHIDQDDEQTPVATRTNYKYRSLRSANTTLHNRLDTLAAGYDVLEASNAALEIDCRRHVAAANRSFAKVERVKGMNGDLQEQLVCARVATLEIKQLLADAVRTATDAVRAKRKALSRKELQQQQKELQQQQKDHNAELAVLKVKQRRKDVKHNTQRYRNGISKAARDAHRRRITELELQNHTMQQHYRDEIAAMSNDFNVQLENLTDTLEAERLYFAEQMKSAKTIEFTTGNSKRCYNDFFRDSARRFLCLGLPPKMVHRCLIQACEMCGMNVDRVGGESAIRAAREELGVMLLGQVGERVDDAIKEGAKMSLHHDATSLLNADGKHLMGAKLRISWPDQPGRPSYIETLTMGVKETLSGSAADETNAIVAISDDIHEMMVPPQVN